MLSAEREVTPRASEPGASNRYVLVRLVAQGLGQARQAMELVRYVANGAKPNK